jgi:hypothetical protein
MAYLRASASLAARVGVLFILTLVSPAFAQQDPCAESGPDCRLLTAAEVVALKSRFLALQALLPVPDPARWAVPPGLSKAMIMDFVSELEAGGAMISGSWPGGAFTERNSVGSMYDGLVKPAATAKDPKDPLAAVEQMQAGMGNRIEILARLLPHAYLVDNIDGVVVEVTESEATDIEKTPMFLSYMYGEGTCLRMIFGPRTDKEAETLRVDRPAKSLAPVICITLEIVGPSRAEVLALKKKIDRKAFEALLGPVMK